MARRLFSLLMTLVILCSCAVFVISSGAETASEKPKISGSHYVAVGKKITLKADQNVTWKSSDKKIATVSGKGVVSGIKAGKVTITATTSGGTKATWKVTVKKNPVKSVKVTASVKKLDLNGSKTVKLTAKASPSSAAQDFTWKSSNTKIATVSSTGKVTAKATGSVTITATATDGSKVKGTVKLTVVKSEKKPKIGVSMPTNTLQRWLQDGEGLKSGLKKAGYDVILRYADNDVETQVNQIKDMISEKCDVLVIAAIEGSSLGSALDATKKKGIPVIAYDRLLLGSDAVSYYTTFDNKKVGTVQGAYIRNALDLDNAEGPFYLEITAGDPGDNNARRFYQGAVDVLKPYIDSGKLVVKSGQIDFADVATTYWSSTAAQERAEDIINSYYHDGPDIDAWLCSNDSTALGIINALDAVYAGKWPVITGQDCDISNIKYMLKGKQSMSVFKDTGIMVSRVITMVDQIVKGKKVEVNDTATYNNNVIIVPTYLCSPVAVDRNNYKKYLIDSGFYTEDQLQ